MNFGTRTLDLLSQNNSEVIGLSNTTTNTLISFFDSGSNYVIGNSNKTFTIFNKTGQTYVGIGTYGNSNANLIVQGSLMTSNINTYNSDSNIYFTNKNITGISNINFTGNLLQSGQPFKTSQWTSINNNADIYYPGNVGIGIKNQITFNTGSNLFIDGSVYITGNIVANTYNDKTNPTAYQSLTFYNNNTNNNKKIITNDSILSNRVLYEFNLSPGRYLIHANIPYINNDNFIALDTVNWATIGLYQSSANNLTNNILNNPIRLTQILAIGSSYNSDIETLTFNWFIDIISVNPVSYVIALNGKGHDLTFGPDNAVVSTVVIPMRGIGYDDSISVRTSIQPRPSKLSFITTQSQNIFTLSNEGYYNVNTSNIDFFVAGSKLADVSYSMATTFQNGYTITTINKYTPVNANQYVDITIWPSYCNIDSSSFYSSGYIYQQINTVSTPFINLTSGGVRLGNKLVIDGDIYLSGTVYNSCNTNIFGGGVYTTGTPPFNTSSNIIGSTNIIDGAIISSKINLLSGNLGIGTTNPSINYRLDINGSMRTSNIYFYPNLYNPNLIIGIPKEFMIQCGTSTSVYTVGFLESFRTTSKWNIYEIRASLVKEGTSSTAIDITLQEGQNDNNQLTIFNDLLTIDASKKTSYGSVQPYTLKSYPIQTNTDDLIKISASIVGSGINGLKITFFYTVRE